MFKVGLKQRIQISQSQFVIWFNVFWVQALLMFSSATSGTAPLVRTKQWIDCTNIQKAVKASRDHFTQVQNVFPRNYPSRMNFPQWMINKKKVKMLILLKKNIFTDKATSSTEKTVTIGILKIPIYTDKHIFNTNLRLMYGAVYLEIVCWVLMNYQQIWMATRIYSFYKLHFSII